MSDHNHLLFLWRFDVLSQEKTWTEEVCTQPNYTQCLTARLELFQCFFAIDLIHNCQPYLKSLRKKSQEVDQLEVHSAWYTLTPLKARPTWPMYISSEHETLPKKSLVFSTPFSHILGTFFNNILLKVEVNDTSAYFDTLFDGINQFSTLFWHSFRHCFRHSIWYSYWGYFYSTLFVTLFMTSFSTLFW